MAKYISSTVPSYPLVRMMVGRAAPSSDARKK